MNKLQKIRKIADDARAWAEDVAHEYDCESDDLCGMCAIASFELYTWLISHGFKAVFCHNNSHCFVEVEGYVVDVTATQFSMKLPRILIRKIGNTPKGKKFAFYNTLADVKKDNEVTFWYAWKRCKTPKEIKKSLKGWPREQLPIPIQKRYI